MFSSWAWHYRVTRRHRSRDHSIPNMQFRMGPPLEPTNYLQRIKQSRRKDPPYAPGRGGASRMLRGLMLRRRAVLGWKCTVIFCWMLNTGPHSCIWGRASNYLAPALGLNASGSRPWAFRVTWHHWWLVLVVSYRRSVENFIPSGTVT